MDHADLAFASLTKGSAKTGSFLVRVLHSKVSTWEYYSKYTGGTKRGHKFECYLVGEDAKEYCIGFAKGEEASKKAAAKFMENTAWRVSKVALDGQADKRYIHTPMKVRIDMEKTAAVPLLKSSAEEKK